MILKNLIILCKNRYKIVVKYPQKILLLVFRIKMQSKYDILNIQLYFQLQSKRDRE